MSPQRFLPEGTLQRGKTKTVARVTLQEKLDEAIAKTANAVEKHNRIGISWRQSSAAIPERQPTVRDGADWKPLTIAPCLTVGLLPRYHLNSKDLM